MFKNVLNRLVPVQDDHRCRCRCQPRCLVLSRRGWWPRPTLPLQN